MAADKALGCHVRVCEWMNVMEITSHEWEREREWKYLYIQFITNSYRFHTSQFPVVRKWVLWRSLVFFYFSCWWQRRHVRLTKSNVHKNKNKNEVQYWCTMSLPPFYLTICLILRALRWTEFFNLFLLSIYFIHYLWVLLYFLILFIDFIVLFNLFFNIFNKKSK